MGSEEELPIFTQTNLGTRIAVAVSPEITAGKFKGEFERAHIGCFPEPGRLSIDAVMVKRNSYYYHLPDLLPLKHVFQGFQGSWFLHVNASRLKNLPDFNNSAKVSRDLAESKSNKQNYQGSKAVLQSAAVVSTSFPLRKKKKRKKKPNVKTFPERFNRERLEQEPKGNISCEFERNQSDKQEVLHMSKTSDSNATAESTRGSFSEAVSVSGIINRYFTDFIDFDHNGSSSNPVVATTTGECDVKISFGKKSSKKRNSVKTCQRLLPSLLPEDLNSASLKSNYERSEVGKRLVVASNNIGSSQRSSMSKGKKFLNSDAGPIIKSLIFEMNTND